MIAVLVALVVSCGSSNPRAEGDAALASGDFAGAEAAFVRALDAQPESIEARIGLGWASHGQANWVAARTAFDDCRTAAPTNPECLRGLASIEVAQGKNQEARELLEQAQKLAPADLKVQASVAMLALAEGQVDAAAAIYERLQQQAPAELGYLVGLAEARFAQKRNEEVLTLVDEGLAAASNGDARKKAALYLLRARALLATQPGLLTPAVCRAQAPDLRKRTLDAQAAVSQAAALGAALNALDGVKELTERRLATIELRCGG